MKEYIFLFRGGDPGRLNEQKNPEAWKAHMMKWKAWMEDLGQKGHFVGGQPLHNEGYVVKGKQKQVTDGPFIEGKEMVGGFVMVKALDLKEALELSKGCPIFEHDGIVEVRPVQELNM